MNRLRKKKKPGTGFISRLFFGSASLFVVAFFIFSSTPLFAATGVPSLINFQGRLLDSSGNLLGGPSGVDYCFKFSIYNASGGGSKIWPSGLPTPGALLVREGVFDGTIGVADTLDLTFTDDLAYVDVAVSAKSGTCDVGETGETYETLSPRPRVVSSGFAINSRTVGGFTPSQSASGSQIPVLTADALILSGASAGLTASGSNNLLLQGGSTGEVRFFSGSNKITNAGALTIAGLLTSSGITTTGAAVSINNNSNFTTDINTGSSSTLVSIGGGSGTFALNTTNIDISGGAITGATGITSATGDITATAGNIVLNATTRISNAGVGTFITGTVIGSQTFTTNNIADSGALTIASGSATALTLNSGTTGTINIGTDASAETINIGNTGAAVKTIAIGNNSQANTITIGDASATSVSITDNDWSITAAGALTTQAMVGRQTLVLGGSDLYTYKTTNAGGTNSPIFEIKPTNSWGTTEPSLLWDATNYLMFGYGNGSALIARASIQLANLDNTAGSEDADLIFLTQAAGAAMSEKFRISNTGVLTASSLAGGGTKCLQTDNGGVISSAAAACGSGTTTLQTAYDASSGNTILTTTARNIAFTLGEVATPTSLTLENQDTAGVSAQRIFNSIASGSLTNGLLIENTNAGGTITNAIQIAETTGTITDGILITGTLGNILNSASIDISGTGAISGATGLASTGTIAFSGAGTFSIDSSAFDVSTGGAVSGVTTIGMSGQLTSTLVTGTAPFVVASTTNVANLNASSLNGATFAAPGPIGSGTPSTGAFTTLTSNGASTIATGSTTNTFGSGASSINTIGSATTPGTLTLLGSTIVAGSANTTAFTFGNVTTNPTFTLQGTGLTTLGGSLTVTGTAWTATPTVSGLITATSGLTANGSITANSGISISTNAITGTTGNIDYTNFDVVGSSGNTDIGGTITAGSSNVAVTDASGHVQHDSIVDCADGQILKWATGGGEWGCATDNSGGGGSLQGAYDGGTPTILTDASGDIIFQLIGGATDTQFEINAASAPEIDMVNLTNAGFGTTTTGVDGLSINFVTGDGANIINSAIDVTLTNGGTAAGDVIRGLTLNNITPTTATEVGLYFGTGYDSDIQFADLTPTMSLADNGTLILSDGSSTTNDIFSIGTSTSRGNALIYGDITLKGSTITKSLTGVIDVFIYDTSADVDGGEWRNSIEMLQRSWASETKDDGAGDVCVIATDDRCGNSAFPRKAIIATTADGLYIFDGANNSLWMKFTQAGTYALGADASNNPSGVTAQNGVVFVGTNGASASGLYAFDFKQDVMYRYNTTNRTQADTNIANRNSTATYSANAETGFAIVSNIVNDVSANIQTGSMEGRAGTLIAPIDSQGGPLLGVTIIAAATDSGVSVINMGSRKVVNYSDATNDDYNQVYMTKRGRMYATNEARAQLEEWRGVDTVITTQANGTPTRIYDETLAAQTPITLAGAAPTISTSPSALAVIERASAAREAAAAGQIDSGDIVFVGTDQGLSEVHTSGGTLATASWSKITTKDSATPYMNGGIRSVYLFDDASGATTSNSAVGATGTTRNPLDQAGGTAPTFGSSGVRGGSVNFNNNSYLCSDANADGTCDSDTDNNVSTTSFTVSMWFKHSTTAAADVLFERCYTPATPAAAVGCVYAGMTTTGTITAGIDDDATFTTVGTISMDDPLTSAGTWNDNQWHHLLLTNTDTDLCMYIDGRLAVACDVSLAAAATLDAAQVLTIGGRCTAANCGTGDSFWDGQIDEFTWSAGATTSSGTVSASANRRFLDGRTHLIRPSAEVTNATTFSATTIGDSGESYISNSFTSLIIEITGGTGAGQTRNIISNDATTFTVYPAWSVTPDATSDYRVSPSKLYGSTNNVTSVAVDAPTQINKTRSLYVGTDDNADGGGVSVFTNAAAGGIKTEVYSSDSGVEADDFGNEWSGSGSDNIEALAIYTDTIVFATGTGLRAQRKDVSLKQLQADTLMALDDVRMSLVASGLFGATQDVLGLGQGADLAEYYYSNEILEAGDVVAIQPDQEAGIGKATSKYQKNLLGVISTRPGLILGPVAENAYAVALSGRVPVKFTEENGPIKVGDLLTSSSKAGYAMRATSAGPVIGRVLNDPYAVTSCDAPLPSLETVEIPEGPWVGGEQTEPQVESEENTIEEEVSINGTKCGYVMLFVGLGESLGKNVETLSQEFLFSQGIEATVGGLTTSGVTEGLNGLPVQQSIMAFLRSVKEVHETNDTALESIFSDRIAAGVDIYTPTLYSDDIFAKNITVDRINATSISGLDELIGRLSTVETAFSANAFDALLSVGTEKLAVVGDSSFAGQSEFTGLSFFTNTTTFNSGVLFGQAAEFTIPPLFNKDSAGFAVIKEGDRRVRVEFDESYAATPVVSASIAFERIEIEEDQEEGEEEIVESEEPQSDKEPVVQFDDLAIQAFFGLDVRSLIVEKDQSGFTIIINRPAPRDIPFSWIALAVRDPHLFESLVEGLTIEEPEVLELVEPELVPEKEPDLEPQIPEPSDEETPKLDESPDLDLEPEPVFELEKDQAADSEPDVQEEAPAPPLEF